MSAPVTVREAYYHVSLVHDSVERLRNIAENMPRAEVIAAIERDVRLQHRCIAALLRTIGVQPHDLVRIGLITHEGTLQNHSNTSDEEMERFDRIIHSVQTLVTDGTENLVIPGYREMLHERSVQRLVTVQDMVRWHRSALTRPLGATEEQINRLGVQIAAEENEVYCCNICLEDIAVGQRTRVLPCSHRFHQDCIDEWLRINGSCPVDRHRIP